MDSTQFSRLLKLAQKTGDRLIVTDPSFAEPVVILPLTEYEGLLDHKSFRSTGSVSRKEERSFHHVPEPEAREVMGEEEDDSFDPEALEEQVKQAMVVVEELEMVPVEPISEPAPLAQVPEFKEEPALRENPNIPRKPIQRKPQKEAGEEQFYLEQM